MTEAPGAPVVLIPAAGAALRMRGTDKLLLPVAGRPLLTDRVMAAKASGARVIVTLPRGAEKRRAALAGTGVEVIEIADAREGMATSLRAGVARAGEMGASGVLVLLPDMPDITALDIRSMLTAFAASSEPAPILRATTADGREGNPVVLPSWLFAAVARLKGDTGARSLLQVHADAVKPFALAGTRALVDLDTPEEWATFRARVVD